MKKTRSIRWKMGQLMVLYWAIPFLILASALGSYMARGQETEALDRLASQLTLNNQICIERIDSVISASRRATYDRTLYNSWQDYRKGTINYSTFYNQGQYYLETQYGKRQEISTAVFMLLSDPRNKRITAYNSPAGGSFRQLDTFWEEDCDGVLDLASELDTSVGVYVNAGRAYIVRNLVDSSYTPWGVLVHRINLDYCLGPLLQMYEGAFARISLDGKAVITEGDQSLWDEAASLTPEKEAQYIRRGKMTYVYQSVKGSDLQMSTCLACASDTVFSPAYIYRYILLITALFLFPLLGLFRRLSTRYVTRPLMLMEQQAREIENGNLGVEQTENTNSTEFEYLRGAFNEMSRTLKYQFDHIYEEELALRDARIMALQSNINPHFMNNTLEIINWEARLSGNEKVSRMIGALSTLMDAAMDREKKPEVPLSEEMVYVDAYLYITRERLGDRLKTEKELDEDTLDQMVPRLIMQPVIENAVTHGIVPRGEGRIVLRSFRQGDFLILEVKNDGTLSEEDREKILALLSPDADLSGESSRHLGIANVNQRLRMLYGEECTLEIGQEEDMAVSRIKIRWNHQK